MLGLKALSRLSELQYYRLGFRDLMFRGFEFLKFYGLHFCFWASAATEKDQVGR